MSPSKSSGPARPGPAGVSWRRTAAAAAVLTAAVLTAAAVTAGAGTAAASPRSPVLAFTPAPYSYGQVTAGQAASQTFTLANTGGQATGALTVTLAGPAAFTATGGTCTGTSLAPGGSCTVTVRFAPVSTATATAALTAAGRGTTPSPPPPR